jgi:uncharacterized secreted repeat protein (TIGR03808 family)
MTIDRRSLIAISAFGGAMPIASLATVASAAPISASGIDATRFGVRAGGGADQTNMLQSAIDQTAGARMPLVLGPGDYRTGPLTLPSGAQLLGVRGATRLVFSGGAAMIGARGGDHITLSGLVIDGGGKPLPQDGALVQLAACRNIRVSDCDILNSSRNGLSLDAVEGIVSGNSITAVADGAVFSRDAKGLTIQGNTIRRCGNNGILVWRSDAGDDGTQVLDNRIEDIAANGGGSGQNGNAINVFRAANVIVRGNRISRAAFSAVRGNAASNIQITTNTVTDVGEVALYVEFGFEGAVVANNTVDGAALGIAVTNFNQGGRLAVVQGNLIRNLKTKRPAGTDPGDAAGVGIAVEADATVSGNVVENAPFIGISLGWGQYLRDVAATGNVIRNAGHGITVSVSSGAGSAVIDGNLIAGATRGAIVGMDRGRVVAADLATEPTRYANLQISGNRVR